MIPAAGQLPPTAEFRTELYLRKPIDLAETEDVRQVCDPSGCDMIFDMRLPDITAVVSVRDSAGDDWRDYGGDGCVGRGRRRCLDGAYWEFRGGGVQGRHGWC